MPIRRRHILPLAGTALMDRAAAARLRAGEVSGVVGTASAQYPGEPERMLAPTAAVLVEDLLATGSGSRLACRLEGGIELRLGEAAKLRLDAFVLHGTEPHIRLRALGGGPLLLDRPPAAGAPPIDILLPWARIGVRGTRLFAGVMGNAGSVFVARGRVTVDAIGTRVVLDAGEGVDVPLVPAGAPDLRVVRWSEARIARAMALVQ